MTTDRLKLWWKQLICIHDWEEIYTSRGVIQLKCKKCGKVYFMF